MQTRICIAHKRRDQFRRREMLCTRFAIGEKSNSVFAQSGDQLFAFHTHLGNVPAVKVKMMNAPMPINTNQNTISAMRMNARQPGE